MIEKGETEVTLPIEMADTEMQLIDYIINYKKEKEKYWEGIC